VRPRPSTVHELLERAILALPRRRFRKATKKKPAAAAYALEEVARTRKKLEKYRISEVLSLYACVRKVYQGLMGPM